MLNYCSGKPFSWKVWTNNSTLIILIIFIKRIFLLYVQIKRHGNSDCSWLCFEAFSISISGVDQLLVILSVLAVFKLLTACCGTQRKTSSALPGNFTDMFVKAPPPHRTVWKLREVKCGWTKMFRKGNCWHQTTCMELQKSPKCFSHQWAEQDPWLPLFSAVRKDPQQFVSWALFSLYWPLREPQATGMLGGGSECMGFSTSCFFVVLWR